MYFLSLSEVAGCCPAGVLYDFPCGAEEYFAEELVHIGASNSGPEKAISAVVDQLIESFCCKELSMIILNLQSQPFSVGLVEGVGFQKVKEWPAQNPEQTLALFVN